MMSKAYVIKNKEGKYWRSKFDKKGNILLTDDIVDAMTYEEDELKILEFPKDCTIIPITICEGDLEEENRVLKAKLETAEYWDRKYDDCQQQLEEKKKEIEELKHFKITIGTMENNQVGISSTTYTAQDKISFAIEQLTQTKEYINKSLEYMWNNNAEMTCRDRNIIDGIYTKLDEQIAELTHQHEDKGE